MNPAATQPSPARLATGSGGVVVVFDGQAAMSPETISSARDLSPDVAAVLAVCDEQLRDSVGWGLPGLGAASGSSGPGMRTAAAQPALYAFQAAVFTAWQSLGLRPMAIAGHSAGELAAMFAAGAVSLADGLRLAVARGRLMQEGMATGALVAVFGDHAGLEAIAPVHRFELAVVNNSGHRLFGGPVTAVPAFVASLEQAGFQASVLGGDRAFHTSSVDGIVADLAELGRTVELIPTQTTLLSGLDGRALPPGSVLGTDHLAARARGVMRFDLIIDAINDLSPRCVIEIGPSDALARIGSRVGQARWLSAHPRGIPPLDGFNQATAIFSQDGDILSPARSSAGPRSAPVAGGREPLLLLPDRPSPTDSPAVVVATPASSVVPVSVAPPRADRRVVDEPSPASDVILDAIRAIVATLLAVGAEELTPDTSFFDLGADSLTLVSLIREVEDAFGIKIRLRELVDHAESLAGLATLVHDRGGTSAATSVDAAHSAARAELRDARSTPSPSVPSQEGGKGNGSDQKTVLSLGPRVQVPRSSGMTSGDLSQLQAEHVSTLTQAVTDRTARSKERAARYRPRLADSRAVVGFRSRTKELLYPIVGQSATGARLRDIDGNDYLDITMGFGTLLFGHDPQHLSDAVQRHLADGMRMGPRTDDAGLAAELLCELTGHDRAAFATSGTEANSAAVRLARAATGKSTVVLFEGAYHGHFDGVLARRIGKGNTARTIPVAPGIPDSAVADVIVLPWDDPASLDQIAALGSQLAAVMVEPVQSRFPQIQPRAFLQQLRAITRRHGVVLIFDEMLTGFRPHIRGAQGLFGVDADLTTYGKVIGGGFPIGAIAGRAGLMDGIDGGQWNYGDASFPEHDTTFFGGTYVQHPVALAAARATFEHLRTEGPRLQESLNRRTDQLACCLNDFFETEAFPLRMVHFGSQFRFDLHDDLELLFPHLLLRGVYVWEWRNFFLSTAHVDADVDLIAGAVESSLTALRAGGFLRRTKPSAGRSTPTGIPAPTTAAELPTSALRPPLPSMSTQSSSAPQVSDRPRGHVSPRLSVYFFGDYPRGSDPRAHYDFIFEAAHFADTNGFDGLWLPERHFHSFGGIFPNPSILAAALARETRQIQLNAGCVVLPLHNPIRVAEEWSVVDNLSDGRVGLGFASGWHPNDFALAPSAYGQHRDTMYASIETVRRLWRGESVPARSGTGQEIEVALFPRPVQQLPPMYTATLGQPESYERAGRAGLGIVTNLMSQDIEQLGEHVTLYRRARAEAGHDPYTGSVVVLLHTYLDATSGEARSRAAEAFQQYLRSSLSLFGQLQNSLGFSIDLERAEPEDIDFLLDQAYERYCERRAAIGDVDHAERRIAELTAAGATEVALFVDFGVSVEMLRESMPLMGELRRRLRTPQAQPQSNTGPAGRDPNAPLSLAQSRIWFAEQLSERPVYNEVGAVRLDGPLDRDVIRAALAQVIAFTPELRTVFGDRRGEPYQRILDSSPTALQVVDCIGQDMGATVTEWAARASATRLDLADGPILAVKLLCFAPESHVLLFTVHHLVFDAESARLLCRRVSEAYRQLTSSSDLGSGPSSVPTPPTTPTPATYADYARAEKESLGSADVSADVAFWVGRMSPLPDPIQLPGWQAGPTPASGQGGSVYRSLSADVVAEIKRTARATRSTLFTLITAALGITVRELCDVRRFAIGTPVSDRPDPFASTTGPFVNALPILFDITADAQPHEVAAAVRDAVLDLHDHPTAPIEEIIRVLNPRRDGLRNPLFQIMIEYDGAEAFALDLPAVTATVLDVAADRALHDLALYLSDLPNGAMRCRFEYPSDQVDAETVDRLAQRFEEHLQSIVYGPQGSTLTVRPSRSAAVGPDPDPVARRLCALGSVADARVLETASGRVAYVIPSDPAADDMTLLSELCGRLAHDGSGGPVPASWAFVSSLPSDPPGGPTPPEPQYSEVAVDQLACEWVIRRDWCKELGVATVPRSASFFTIGGHSLSAMRSVSRLQRDLDPGLKIAELFSHPTVESLAQVVAPRLGRSSPSVLDHGSGQVSDPESVPSRESEVSGRL